MPIKYRFPTTFEDSGTCSERCMVLNDGTMIGSIRCRLCEFCTEHQKPTKESNSIRWIKCTKLKEAKGLI